MRGTSLALVAVAILATVLVSGLIPVASLGGSYAFSRTGGDEKIRGSVSAFESSKASELFVKSVCTKISALGGVLEHENVSKTIKISVVKALNLCRKAMASRGRRAIALAIEACRAFAPAAIYVARHLRNSSVLNEAVSKIVEESIRVRMIAVESLEKVLSRVPRTNLTEKALDAAEKYLNTAKKYLEEAQNCSARGEVAKAEKFIAVATMKIVEASRIVRALFMRAMIVGRMMLHGIAVVERMVGIAYRALRIFENSSDIRALGTAFKSLSLAINYVKRMELELNLLGMEKASNLANSLAGNLSIARELVAKALNEAERGSVNKAKNYASQALSVLETLMKVRVPPRRWISENHYAVYRARSSVASCVNDEIGTLIIAREMLKWLAMHSRNSITKLNAELALTMIDEYLHHLVKSLHTPLHHGVPHRHPHLHHRCGPRR